MAQVIGNRTTYQTITTEARNIRRVDDEIYLLEPNEGPLLTILNKLKKRQATDNTKFEWLEDDYVARWATMSATTCNASSSSTTVVVADGTLFVPGDLFVVPKAVSSSAAPEMVRVVSISSNTLTVVRDVGGNGVDTIDGSGALRIIGSAFEENSSALKMKSTSPASKFAYTQIFKTVIDFSNTAAASAAYGAPAGERKREHAKKLKEHKITMNGQLLFGVTSQDLTGGPGGNPIRTAAGIISVISSNKTDGGGTVTSKTLESFARSAFRYGGKKKILLASPLLCSAVNAWAKRFLQIKSTETDYGLTIQTVTTGHGEWLMVRDWMLENGVSSKNGYGGVGLSLDLDYIKYRYLSANGKNRDTHIREDVVQDGRDGMVDEIITEGGFQIMQEKYHGMIYNITDYVE